MAFYKVSTAEDQVKDRGENVYINKSGIYDVILKHVIVNKSNNGSEAIDLVIEYEGVSQTLFGAVRLTNNDGSTNFGANMFNKLCIVCGASEGTEIADPVPVELPIGKGGEMKECMELAESAFQDEPITIRIQLEYGMYDGSIKERKVLKNIFRTTDHATAQEIVNNTDFGKQYIQEEKSADKVTYKDGILPEDVEKWRKEKMNGTKENKDDTSSKYQRHSFGRVV